ncbi:MAG: copper chaperone PCu(A)C [Pseudolabrys sp.]
MTRFVFAALAAFVAVAAPASAHDYTVGSLKIEHPWARATPKGAAVGGGYMKITNTGGAPDRLLGGSSEAAGKFEIHEMSMEGGVMKMRMLPKGLTIKPGETVEFKPGSYHVMFMGLKKPLVEGESFKGTLVFEKAGKIEVEYKVDKLAAPSSGHGGSHGGMKH